MIDGGPDNGQPEGDVYGAAKTYMFKHRQALIVIHRQHHIAVLQCFRGKSAVGRQRTAHIDTVCPQFLQRGRASSEARVSSGGVSMMEAKILRLSHNPEGVEHE